MPEQATRTTVTEMWQAVLDGTISREDAHAWAAEWVEAVDPQIDDVMVMSALQRLHGFDLVWDNVEQTIARHGGSGVHLHSLTEVGQALATWRDDCRSYDADPAGFVQRKVAAARSAVQRGL